MNEAQLVKIVYKDNERNKAVAGRIEGEDDFFISLRADRSNILIRIGKASVVSIKDLRSGPRWV